MVAGQPLFLTGDDAIAEYQPHSLLFLTNPDAESVSGLRVYSAGAMSQSSSFGT